MTLLCVAFIHNIHMITPQKINIEPENQPFEKENHLPNLHFGVQATLTNSNHATQLPNARSQTTNICLTTIASAHNFPLQKSKNQVLLRPEIMQDYNLHDEISWLLLVPRHQILPALEVCGEVLLDQPGLNEASVQTTTRMEFKYISTICKVQMEKKTEGGYWMAIKNYRISPRKWRFHTCLLRVTRTEGSRGGTVHLPWTSGSPGKPLERYSRITN